MSFISVGRHQGPILEFLDEWGTDNLEIVSCKDLITKTKVFVNGNWVGVHPHPDALMNKLRSLRRNVSIDPEISIVRDIKEREVRIYTDGGRIARPLFVVGDDQRLAIKKRHILKLKDDKDDYNWTQLVLDGLVEFIDTEEEETTLIAMKVSFKDQIK